MRNVDGSRVVLSALLVDEYGCVVVGEYGCVVVDKYRCVVIGIVAAAGVSTLSIWIVPRLQYR
jgi:hypothetical protein